MDRAARLIDNHVDHLDPERRVRDRACARALALLGDGAAGTDTPRLALIGFARDILAELAVELTADLPALRKLICWLESAAGIPALELGRELLAAPQLLALPPEVAIDVELKLLLAATSANSVSLWRTSSSGQVEQIARVGNDEAARHRTRRLAHRLLTGGVVEDPLDCDVAGVPIASARGRAVLVWRGCDPASVRHRLLVEASLPVLAAALDRSQRSSRPLAGAEGANGDTDQAGPAERRLARVRFDLHDGPQQDLLLLAEDLRLFRSQLDSVLASNEARARVRGRFDDLAARLIAVDGDLRRISAFVESPFLHDESLPDALADVVEAFAGRTHIEPQVRLDGDFGCLTDSQQIALLGLIREALGNIRQHADAEHVTISLSSDARGITATVRDDGRGFDPEAALVKAARGGHLGLVGMHERVRMLGGQTKIDSKLGGPTVISAALPAWPPVEA